MAAVLRPSRSEALFLRDKARLYCWDMPDPDDPPPTDRVVRRVMDLGMLDDILEMQAIFGKTRLADILVTSDVGAMRERSRWFWHYRLGLADADHDPPPMPARRLA